RAGHRACSASGRCGDSPSGGRPRLLVCPSLVRTACPPRPRPSSTAGRCSVTLRVLAMVAGLGLVLVSGAAWSDQQPNFVCLANGTCVYLCASDRDCIKAGCLLPHCDTHTPDGQLCLSDHAAQFCTQATDCPIGKVCDGNLCETACSP